jgi:integral membrane sensor domain MASE1
LKSAGSTFGIVQYLQSSVTEAKGWLSTLVEAIGIAVVYFLAARFGLALLSSPSDVAVFWPASGVAVGILIVAGGRAGPPLVAGVVIGTVAANLMSDRSLLTSLLKGFCNAGEAVVVAWLLERWFGWPFRFADLRRVTGFLAAAGLAAALSAIGGAATMALLHTTAPYWDVWRTWFLSDGVGIVVVAPLVIGLAEMARKPPSRGEWIEGIGVLGLTVIVSSYAMNHKAASWLSFSPGAIVLPLLLWLSARCPPPFGRAGAFIASSAVILATTFGIGRFGDTAVPIIERVRGAQVATTMITIYTLVLIALFAERKEAEEELRESKGELTKKSAALARLHEVGTRLWRTRDMRQALDEILAGAIELLSADMGTIRILDRQRGTLKVEAHRGFKQKALDFVDGVPAAGDSLCGRVLRAGERIVIEDVETDDLFVPFRPLARAAGYRAMQSTPIMSPEGMPLGMLATHFRSVHKPSEHDLRMLDLYVRQASDIIERYNAENTIRDSEERLRLAQLRTGIGIWDRNLRTGTVIGHSHVDSRARDPLRARARKCKVLRRFS